MGVGLRSRQQANGHHTLAIETNGHLFRREMETLNDVLGRGLVAIAVGPVSITVASSQNSLSTYETLQTIPVSTIDAWAAGTLQPEEPQRARIDILFRFASHVTQQLPQGERWRLREWLQIPNEITGGKWPMHFILGASPEELAAIRERLMVAFEAHLAVAATPARV